MFNDSLKIKFGINNRLVIFSQKRLFWGGLMGFFDKVFSKKADDEQIEDFLNNLDVSEESMYENADALVKPMVLNEDADVAKAIEEMKKGNILLLNIGEMQKRNALKLREYISAMKTVAGQIDGDIARISADRVLVTPSKVKIIKKRGAD